MNCVLQIIKCVKSFPTTVIIFLSVGDSQCAVWVYPFEPPGLGSIGVDLGCGLVGSAEQQTCWPQGGPTLIQPQWAAPALDVLCCHAIPHGGLLPVLGCHVGLVSRCLCGCTSRHVSSALSAFWLGGGSHRLCIPRYYHQPGIGLRIKGLLLSRY